MIDNITVTGVVGTDPSHHVTSQGLAITSFRLASTRRYFDRAKGSWEDGETNWYTVSTFRQLASNASMSIRKGERVVVHGRLRLRAWETGEKSGTAVEIEAEAIGHDLAWCVTSYARVRSARASDASAVTTTDGTLIATADDPAPLEDAYTGVAGSGWLDVAESDTVSTATDADGEHTGELEPSEAFA